MIHAKYVGKIVIKMEIPDGAVTMKEVEQAFNDEMSKAIEELLVDELEDCAKVTVTKLEVSVEESKKSS